MYLNCCCFASKKGDDDNGTVSMGNPLNINSPASKSDGINVENEEIDRSSIVSAMSNAERTQPREGVFGALKTMVNHRSKIFVHNDTSSPIFAKISSAESNLPIILCVETINPNEYKKISLTDSKCVLTIAKSVKTEAIDEIATANANALKSVQGTGTDSPLPIMHTVEKICIYEENKVMKDRDVYKAQEKRYKTSKPIRTITVPVWERECGIEIESITSTTSPDSNISNSPISSEGIDVDGDLVYFDVSAIPNMSMPQLRELVKEHGLKGRVLTSGKGRTKERVAADLVAHFSNNKDDDVKS